MKEIWKPIKEYEGLYEVSSFGNIARVDKNRKNLKFWNTTKGYKMVGLCKSNKVEKFLVHRLVAQEFLGDVTKKQIDHIDGSKDNNVLSNLRICTQSQNNQNRHVKKKNTSSKYKGVHYFKVKNTERYKLKEKYILPRPWTASITKDKKEYALGYFETEELAAIAYNKKAKELFGEFAKLNEYKDLMDKVELK